MSRQKRVRPSVSSEESSEDGYMTEKKPFSPRTNIFQHDESANLVTVRVGLPGLTPADVAIDLLHDKLTISGEVVDPQASQELKGVYSTRELSFGKFSRVLPVPLGMKPENFKARMKNGLLTLTFPKDPPKQIPHRIPIE